MKIGLFWRVLPVYLLIVFIFVLPIWQRHNALIHAEQASVAAQAQLSAKTKLPKKLIKGRPERIILPSIGIDIPVVNGTYDGKQTIWTVASTTANYAQNTALANNKHYKTLIYGHWTKRIFGKTADLKVGDLAYIYTSNNHIFKYSYRSKQVINPSDIEIFRQFKGKPGLVLMTCQGLWAQQRRIMLFDLRQAR